MAVTRRMVVAVVAVAQLGCAAPASPRPVEDGAPDAAVPVAFSCPGVSLPARPAADGTKVPADVWARVVALEEPLARALEGGDAGQVGELVCQARALLGPWQGVAEAPSGALPGIPTTPPEPQRVLRLFVEAFRQGILGQEPWNQVRQSVAGVDQQQPLRGACSLIGWTLAARAVAGPDDARTLEASAREGLGWLLRVQTPDGLFPFPDLTDDWERLRADCRARGVSDGACFDGAPRALQLAALGRQAWEGQGRPAAALREGWWVESPGDPGGLQFDNGMCGEALVKAFQALGEPQYLAAGVRAARWAARQVPVLNWNYNAFSVELLARVARHDASSDWAGLALQRARLGVLPGLMENGRFFDPHNARMVYHAILFKAVAALARETDDARVHAALRLLHGRVAREVESDGAAAIDDGIAAFLLAEASGLQAPDALHRLVNAGLRTGRATSGGVALFAEARQ